MEREKNQKTKPHKEVKTPKEAKNRSEWIEQKKETKDEEWKK